MSVIAAEPGTWKPYRKFASGSGTANQVPEEEIDRTVDRVSFPLSGLRWGRGRIGRNMIRSVNRWVFETAVLNRFTDANRRPDLLIWRYPLSLTSLRVLRVLRRTGVPMMRVVTMYGGPGGNGWRRRAKELAFPFPFRYLDCVLVSSDVMRENLRTLGVSTRIAVLPHGVDLERFRPHPAGPTVAPVRERLGFGPRDKMVLFVGPLSERKGTDLLAEAWSSIATAHARAHLVLVGPEPEGSGVNGDPGPTFPESLRHTLKAGSGGDRVRFVGAVSDVEEYLRGADLFVFPSRREGMPNAVLEAFASGAPCVLGPFQGLSKDLGRPGKEFLLVDHDPILLAQAVVSLLSDDFRRRELGSAALSWARDHMGLDRSLDRLAELCYELVGSGKIERSKSGASAGTR